MWNLKLLVLIAVATFWVKYGYIPIMICDIITIFNGLEFIGDLVITCRPQQPSFVALLRP